jgi:hypothetical protein
MSFIADASIVLTELTNSADTVHTTSYTSPLLRKLTYVWGFLLHRHIKPFMCFSLNAEKSKCNILVFYGEPIINKVDLMLFRFEFRYRLCGLIWVKEIVLTGFIGCIHANPNRLSSFYNGTRRCTWLPHQVLTLWIQYIETKTQTLVTFFSLSSGYPLIKLPDAFLKPSKWKRQNHTWTSFSHSEYGSLLKLFNLTNNISIAVNYNKNGFSNINKTISLHLPFQII